LRHLAILAAIPGALPDHCDECGIHTWVRIFGERASAPGEPWTSM
jgi:hypothetical protein